MYLYIFYDYEIYIEIFFIYIYYYFIVFRFKIERIDIGICNYYILYLELFVRLMFSIFV